MWPLCGQTPPAKTFSELCDYWLTYCAPQKRKPKDDQSIIRRHLRPAFGELKLGLINRSHVDKFLSEKRHLDKKTQNNHLTLMISMLNVAKDQGWLIHVPKIKKPKVPLFSKDYDYLRTKDEILRFLVSARAEGTIAFGLYATAIHTGMRAGELAALTWADVDLDRRLITVQRSFRTLTKSGAIRHVPILDSLLPVLRAHRLAVPGELVFPNEAGGMHQQSARVFQEVLRRVLTRTGFQRYERDGRRLVQAAALYRRRGSGLERQASYHFERNR